MKILLATPLYPPDHGGPATDAAILEKKLPEFGIMTRVYTFGEVRHLPKGIRHIVYAYGLYKRLHNIDCIVAMDTFSVCLPAAIIAKLTGKFFVIRVPGDFVWEQATQRFGVTDTLEAFQKRRYGLKVELLRAIQIWSVKKADLVVTCSDFLKKIVATWGVSENKLIRIYLGADMNENFTLPTTKPEGKIIFSLGRFVPWKGFAMLIDLISELPPEWNLVIAGNGPILRDLEKQAGDLGVSNRVTFTGVLTHDEVLGWFKTSVAFLFNTSFESFSFQLLEAMASGTPVITTTAGSVPELVRDGVDGVLCMPDDKEAFKKALMSMYTDPLVWEKRITSAQARAQEFSVQKSVSLFAKELTRICG